MNPQNNHNGRSFLANHLTLFALILFLAGGLYLLLWNTTTVVVGGVVLLLAHLAAATGLVLLVRKGWLKLFNKDTKQG